MFRAGTAPAGRTVPARSASGLVPQYVGASLPVVRRSGSRGMTVKLRPGQSLVMLGGLVPHRVLPVHSGQARVVSALCFVAGTAAEIDRDAGALEAFGS